MKAAAVGVTAAVLGLMMKKAEPEQTLLLGALAAAVILAAGLTAVREVGAFLSELTAEAGLRAALTAPVLKCVGIAVAGRYAADVCRDAGQSASASALELASAAAAVYTAIPLLRALMDMIVGFA